MESWKEILWQMNLKEKITDSRIFAQNYILRDGYEFKPLTYPPNIYDAIVIRNPGNIKSNFRIPSTKHSLSEHIDFINKMELEKAIIFSNDISFITQCQTLKHLEIIPYNTVNASFDFSPLYEMNQIRSLVCKTECIESPDKLFGTIDYNRIKGLESVSIVGKGHLNYNNISTLKTLSISGYQHDNLSQMFCSKVLDTLSLTQCSIKSLYGIDKSERMQCLYLDYNRSLQDISALRQIKCSLKALHIYNCPKITDFTVLEDLDNLEMLELFGSNVLPNLDFISNMKSLKSFGFSMNVESGNLSPCLNLQYAYSQNNRKNYNLKDNDLPKFKRIRGNESIEQWRRLE